MTRESAWSAQEAIGATTGDNHAPALATVGETLHVVWQWDRALYHAWRSADRWSSPQRITAGEQPALATTPDGALHCLFSHWVANNAEIYYVRWTGKSWSLPALVSRTSGASMHPALTATADGALHAAWTDTTPGRPVIYYGQQVGPAWRNAAIPNAAGSRPTLAALPSGEVGLAWQERLQPNSRFDIFASFRAEGAWSLPENVSDNSEKHSICPKLAVSETGFCHLVWQEEGSGGFGIRHADRRPNGWSTPTDVSTGAIDCRQPTISAQGEGLMQVAWSAGAELRYRERPPNYDAAWGEPEIINAACTGLSDLTLNVSANNVTHVIWSGYGAGNTRSLFYSHRSVRGRHTAFLPTV